MKICKNNKINEARKMGANPGVHQWQPYSYTLNLSLKLNNFTVQTHRKDEQREIHKNGT